MEYLYTLQVLRESSPDVLNMLLLAISESVLYAGPIITLVIYWCVSKKTGSWMMFSLGWGLVVMDAVKLIACVPRPWLLDGRLQPAAGASSSATGYSFPSGHTAVATAAYGTCAVAAANGEGAVGAGVTCAAAGEGGERSEVAAKPARTLTAIGTVKKRRIWLSVALGVLVLLVAFARNWLGAHTLADVLASIGITSVVAGAMYAVMVFLERKPKADVVVAGAMLLALCAVGVGMSFVQLPTAYDAAGNILVMDHYELSTDLWESLGLCAGLIIGWIVERRFINFRMEGSRKTRTLRGIFGVAVFGLMYLVIAGALTSWIPDLHLAKFLKRLIAFAVTTIAVPLCIKWYQSRQDKRTAAKS